MPLEVLAARKALPATSHLAHVPALMKQNALAAESRAR